jgi:integrase
MTRAASLGRAARLEQRHDGGARVGAGQLRLRIVDSTRLNANTIMPSYYHADGLNQVAEAWRGKPILTAQQIEEYRDDRLSDVSHGAVYREFSVLLGFFTKVGSTPRGKQKTVWRLIEASPIHATVDRPKDSDALDVVVSQQQLQAHLAEATTDLEKRAAAAFAFACWTGVRRGEAAQLTRFSRISDDVVLLHKTKNGDQREVPVCDEAKQFLPVDGFGLSVDQLHRGFAAVRDRLVAKGSAYYTFHAARHTAATYWGKSGLYGHAELCKFFGWHDPKMALRYIKTDGASLAEKMKSRNAQVLRLAA